MTWGLSIQTKSFYMPVDIYGPTLPFRGHQLTTMLFQICLQGLKDWRGMEGMVYSKYGYHILKAGGQPIHLAASQLFIVNYPGLLVLF